jgi:hypothetical protein
MRPDQRWFPTNRTERAGWFGNFATNFAELAIGLGFTQADIDAVNADNAVVQFLKQSILESENYLAAVKEFQRNVTLGQPSPAVHNFPQPPVFSPPPGVPTGIFDRLERLVRRIRVAPGYSPSIGAALQIIPRGENRTDLENIVPKIKTQAGPGNYSFVVRTTRGVFSGFYVEIRRQGSDRWELADSFQRSPGEVVIEPSKPGEPEAISVRIRMRKGNDPVGAYSDIQSVVLVP